jgi:hypothetical protein
MARFMSINVAAAANRGALLKPDLTGDQDRGSRNFSPPQLAEEVEAAEELEAGHILR